MRTFIDRFSPEKSWDQSFWTASLKLTFMPYLWSIEVSLEKHWLDYFCFVGICYRHWVLITKIFCLPRIRNRPPMLEGAYKQKQRNFGIPTSLQIRDTIFHHGLNWQLFTRVEVFNNRILDPHYCIRFLIVQIDQHGNSFYKLCFSNAHSRKLLLNSSIKMIDDSF